MLRASTTAWPTSHPSPERVDGFDPIERIEAWVAGNLDGPDNASTAGGMDDWHRKAFDILKPRKAAANPSQQALDAAAGWVRIRVVKKSGVTIVRLNDKSLVKETDLRELSEELFDLILAGHRRLIVDFTNVERLSCQILPILAEGSRMYAEDGGGMLKVVNLRPELSPVVRLSPLTRSFDVPTDESAALGGPWPESGPRPLPVALVFGLNAMKRSSEASPMPPSPPPDAMSEIPFGDDLSPEVPAPCPCLIVAEGRSAGRKVRIDADGVLIGRDPGCRVRSDHAHLSRRHAYFRSREGRAWLRDLGSTNGTLLNGKRVGRDEIEVFAGDRVQIGPLKFAVSMSDPRRASIDDVQIANWLVRDAEEEPTQVAHSSVTAFDVPSTSRPLRVEKIEDVVVITPLDPELLQTSEPALIRDELAALIDSHASRRVVLNLEHAGRLSNATLGVLVAYHLRLDRLGGALRLCEPHARVAQFLEQIRLPMLLDVFPTKEDAVLEPWERPESN